VFPEAVEVVAAEAAIAGRPLRIVFEDEARFGRLPVIRSAWAPPGIRPVVAAAVERDFRYVYGAVSPFEGELDWMCAEAMNTENMNTFLLAVSESQSADYILMVLDGASSHTTTELKIPDNMALLTLPPYSPELNPAESIWDHAREKACANQYFARLDHVMECVVDELTRLSESASQVIGMFLRPWIIHTVIPQEAEKWDLS